MVAPGRTACVARGIQTSTVWHRSLADVFHGTIGYFNESKIWNQKHAHREADGLCSGTSKSVFATLEYP